MLDDINADRFLTERRIIDIRRILPDIERYIAETADPERKAWLQQTRKDFLDELAEHEARLLTLETA